jgi:glutamine synthetase
MATRNERHLSMDDLVARIGAGEIDTVVVAFTDMQGRLQGKRLHGRYFVEHVVGHGTEGCNYLLAVDVDMNTVGGYAISSWERGYGDMEFVMDEEAIRLLTHLPATALVQCDLVWPDHSPVLQSPRGILRAQLDRVAERGWTALAGTELEFIAFEDTYEAAGDANYRGLTPVNQYNVDYSMLGTARIEPLLRRIRLGMAGAGMVVESAKGECNLGQHEIAFRYGEALSTCDDHVLYKTGAKEIAAQDGRALTFMAKYDEREGNSCHIHLSLRSASGEPVFSDGGHGHSPVFDSFLAGMLAGLRELTLFCAPNVNSYKRYVPGSFAPTAMAWGRDNRTCALRVVGHSPPALRVENRVPGGDVNPYLAVAAMLAAGLDGIERELPLEPAFVGNAYLDEDRARVPATLRDAAALWTDSALARGAFGDDVVDHYANNARVELAAYDSAVTDWERRRGFERL